MRKLILILFLIILFTTACTIYDKSSVIVFNDEPFSKDNFTQVKTNFKSGDRIYYLFATRKKLSSPYIRVQISSITDKTSHLFYKPVWSGDYKLMKDEVHYYTNYVVLNSRGKYLMQIFKEEDLHHPLCFAFFVIN